MSNMSAFILNRVASLEATFEFETFIVVLIWVLYLYISTIFI